MLNKKSQVGIFLPYIMIGVIIAIVFALVAIPMAHVGDEIFDELKKTKNFGESDTSVENINVVQGLMTPAFDQLVFIVLFSVLIGGMVLAIFTDFHPVILVILILAIVLLVIVAGLLSNVYDEVKENDILSSKADEFTFTNVVMGPQLPIIILIFGAITIIIVLAKRGRQVAPV